ncbi:hypothetical protein Acid345_4371 [Candidatus Koribacter versatilis Ellin345]|uniref:Uncharacterized protein n=2 Tax=Candidatus Korobacter versatilis TaxID=658062 RepID=Q1IIC9_KORVE|nr:hypothetical protein Acid345_4371 [Candidatus Koribacter versatilis Ellin345]
MREPDREDRSPSTTRTAHASLRMASVLTGRVSERDAQAFRSELFQYRYETVALLQKYLTVSLDLGRLPSVLGGEMFRAKVTSYKVTGFEELVIFVTDFGKCLERLGETARRFIVLNIFEEYSKEESARRIGCEERSARRIYCDAIDEMSEILLRFRLIEPMDWIGDELAREGWFEGCPVLRRNAWSLEHVLPPKKGCGSEGVPAKAKVLAFA